LNKLGPGSCGSLILVGTVIRPHGLSGLLRIRSYAESERSFINAGTVFLRSVSGECYEYTVTSVEFHKNIFLMKLEEVLSREKAEELRGAEIFISKEALGREDDEFFWYELLGLKVCLDTGEYIGVLSNIISTQGSDIYVVKEGNKEILVPAVYEVIKDIDLENGTLCIAASEGLLDLNEI